MATIFTFFNEIGIISQLSSTLLAKALPDGVHPSHFAIVNHLVRMGDGKAPIRIAGAMQVTKTTMTHSLKVLTDRGYIRTEPNPDDARGKLVFLTPEGRAFREEAIRRVAGLYGAMLSPEQVAAMARLMPDLREIRAFLDKNRLD